MLSYASDWSETDSILLTVKLAPVHFWTRMPMNLAPSRWIAVLMSEFEKKSSKVIRNTFARSRESISYEF